MALAHQGTLPIRFRELAHGLDDYVNGRADSAVTRFRRAIALDPTAAEPWMWLAETYNHLLPAPPRSTTLAERSPTGRSATGLDACFAECWSASSGFAARRGDRAETARLLPGATSRAIPIPACSATWSWSPLAAPSSATPDRSATTTQACSGRADVR